WMLATLLIIVGLQFVGIFVGNGAMDWQTVWQYLFDPSIVSGAETTVILTVLVMAFAAVLGTALAFMRLSRNPVIPAGSWCFLWVFRSVPVLVWLLFWYFLAALLPSLRIGIPFGPTLFEAPTNEVIGQTGAAVLGLGLTESAYMAEIIRGGILSVGRGQREAALAIGLTGTRAMLRIVLPQALKTVWPAVGNQAISTLKATSLVPLIGIPDLMTNVQQIYIANFRQIPLLTVACLWYLAMTSLLSVVQRQLERRANRGG
ncbi:MAG: amino acid ABC transporter permease, partial [Acetobacteraceae bacterium]